MDERSGRWAVVMGAAIGALAGYLLGTPKGRRICNACVNVVDDFALECARFSRAVARAQLAASDSWKALEQWGEESRLFTHQGITDSGTSSGTRDLRMGRGNGQEGGEQ